MRHKAKAHQQNLKSAKNKQYNSNNKKINPKTSSVGANQKDIIEIDFHGLFVRDAIELLENTINRALMDEIGQINIVHGFGTGKIKEAVHQYLSESKYISAFRLSITNPGVTIIYL